MSTLGTGLGHGEPIEARLTRVASRIAPAWPLDRSIAVNPFWEMTDTPFEDLTAKLAVASGARPYMPRAYFREALRAGTLEERHLAGAARERPHHAAFATEALLQGDEPTLPRNATVVDLQADADRVHAFVVHHIGQHCAAHFDRHEATPTAASDGDLHLYGAYVVALRGDHALGLTLGARAAERARGLPDTPAELAQRVLRTLAVPGDVHDDYLLALLLDVQGWASHAAYRRWVARQDGRAEDRVVDVLAMRLAWEWILLDGDGPAPRPSVRPDFAMWKPNERLACAALAAESTLQRAMEIAWRDAFVAELSRTAPLAKAVVRPDAQAVFCIDVRSERMRRALEAAAPDVATLGFAGFFGAPLAWRASPEEHVTPRLPGLVAPKLEAHDEAARARPLGAALRSVLRSFERAPASVFAYVEALGLAAAPKLLVEASSGASDTLRSPVAPRIAGGADADARVQLAAGILAGMSLTRDFAPLVVLVGHGSSTRNNPLAAALQCGACGGHAGDVNARVVAALLNEPAVRQGLDGRGVHIPSTTVFVAALHDTTTDEVTFFDDRTETEEHRERLRRLRASFARASHAVRLERAPSLGLAPSDRLDAAYRARARDWTELRPEWGLADNAAFVAAPRARTRGLDLGGRVFLHDYRAEEDDGGRVLELILTAPMVVAHWINLQYYASTVDNDHYGSGNKVLHNVVGGNLGVFEGNGGDLRVGLALQSVHDGDRWVHTPRRLSVFVEAPREAIDAVLAKHDAVRRLVDNRWLFLHQIDEDGRVHARTEHGWSLVVPDAEP